MYPVQNQVLTSTLLYPTPHRPYLFSGYIGDDHYPTQNQALHGVSGFVDSSGPIFSMYLELATEEDKKMVENWKADADGILIFVCPLSRSPL